MYEIKNYLNGDYIKGSGQKRDIISPTTGEIIGFYNESTNNDLQKMIPDIQKAQKSWSKLTLRERSKVFYKYRELLMKNKDELAQINSMENGKMGFEACGGIAKAIEIVEYACSLPNSIKTRIAEVSKDIFAYEEKRPIGIVASITPFNFPSMIPHWTMPIAIMAGNAMILKPSELTPISAFKIAELLKEAGLPDGIFNIVNGGKNIVENICENKSIQGVTFVGSSMVAKIVYEKSTKNHKKVLAMGESKNHIIVTPDIDPQIVANNVIASAFGMSGQRCMAASVIIPVGKFHFKNELITTLAKQQMGKDYGAIITQRNLDKIEEYIKYAERNNGEIIVDGRKVSKINNGGFWIGPTVIDWKNNVKGMKAQEVFGPVLEVVHASSLEEAITIQNNSPYGNGASIFTQNGSYASRAIKGLQAGMIGVNIGVPVPREPFSFGGIKDSIFGNGNITGDLLFDFVTNTIKITQKWNVQKDRKDWMS